VAGILFIISAPSGSGKSTLVSELRKQVSGVDFAISWTTRAPRGSEENGREYYFTTREEFQRMIDAGMFLERSLEKTFTARRAKLSTMPSRPATI
jgi:guanylate kinase